LYLVDLAQHQLHALSYGFISSQALAKRCLDVSTHFDRYSYRGLKNLEENNQ